MALNIAANQLLAYLDGYPNHATIWVLSLGVWFLVLIIPASTMLCGALFGSWRGLLASVLSIGGGLLLILGFNNFFSGFQGYLSTFYMPLQPWLIPGLLAALAVGVIYDFFRHDEKWGKSFLPLLLGSVVVYVGFIISLSAMYPNGTWGPLSACLFVCLIPVSTFSMAGLEWLLRRFIVPRSEDG
jgi:hypothetical protein